jgi:hypothetical protein
VLSLQCCAELLRRCYVHANGSGGVAALSRMFTNVGISFVSISVAALQLQTQPPWIELVSYAAIPLRRRIPVRLSHGPSDSSTGFSYACGMSVCFPYSPRRPGPAGAITGKKSWGPVWRRVWETSLAFIARGRSRDYGAPQSKYSRNNTKIIGEENGNAKALYANPGATLDDLRDAVATLEETERIARRVLGIAHPHVRLLGGFRTAKSASRAPRPRSAGERLSNQIHIPSYLLDLLDLLHAQALVARQAVGVLRPVVGSLALEVLGQVLEAVGVGVMQHRLARVVRQVDVRAPPQT